MCPWYSAQCHASRILVYHKRYPISPLARVSYILLLKYNGLYNVMKDIVSNHWNRRVPSDSLVQKIISLSHYLGQDINKGGRLVQFCKTSCKQVEEQVPNQPDLPPAASYLLIMRSCSQNKIQTMKYAWSFNTMMLPVAHFTNMD